MHFILYLISQQTTLPCFEYSTKVCKGETFGREIRQVPLSWLVISAFTAILFQMAPIILDILNHLIYFMMWHSLWQHLRYLHRNLQLPLWDYVSNKPNNYTSGQVFLPWTQLWRSLRVEEKSAIYSTCNQKYTLYAMTKNTHTNYRIISAAVRQPTQV